MCGNEAGLILRGSRCHSEFHGYSVTQAATNVEARRYTVKAPGYRPGVKADARFSWWIEDATGCWDHGLVLPLTSDLALLWELLCVQV